MTPHDRPEGRPTGVGTPRQGTPGSPVRGSYVHLGPDLEVVAAEILERRGPDFCARLAAELLAPIRGLRAEVTR